MRAGLGVVLSLALAAGLGCAGRSESTGAIKDSPRPDATQSNLLRERAIAVIEEMAASPDARVRANAMEAATLIPARAAELLERGVRDKSAAVCSVALMSAGRLREAALKPEAEILLRADASFVRVSALYALVRMGAAVDRSSLADVLMNDPSLKARAHAAYVLGEIGDASAMALLRQAGRNRPARAGSAEFALFQLQVSEALVKLGEDGELNPLRAALYPAREEDLESTALAVQILGQVQDRGSVDQMIYLSASRDKAGNRMPAEVRLAVAGSLARLGLPQGNFIADEFAGHKAATLRAQAAYVYGETGRAERLGALEGLMKDPEPAVRVSAAASILKTVDRELAQAQAR